jgi:NTP pyrophosphatase (non-canonical NTP hydrolase)
MCDGLCYCDQRREDDAKEQAADPECDWPIRPRHNAPGGVARDRETTQKVMNPLFPRPMTVNELVAESYDRALRKGWYEDAPNLGERLALVHSEVSEALEELRNGAADTTYKGVKGKPEGFVYELADIVIRVADLAGYLDLDLEAALRTKGDYNETREHRHGKKF